MESPPPAGSPALRRIQVVQLTVPLLIQLTIKETRRVRLVQYPSIIQGPVENYASSSDPIA